MAARTIDTVARPDMSARMIAFGEDAARSLPLAQRRALWRNLIQRFPQEQAFALHYVVELLMSEAWEELDTFASRARRYRAAPIDLRYIDVALARFELSRASQQIDRYERLYGLSEDSQWRRYDLRFFERRYEEAALIADAIKSARRRNKRRPAILAKKARLYGALKSRWTKAGKPAAATYDIYVINLDSDVVRMKRIDEQLAGYSYLRIPGVRGSYLPDFVVSATTNGYGIGLKGTFGCFLSHVVAWERIAESGRPGLVLEDDAGLLAALPAHLRELKVPDDYDVCFVNDGMLPGDFTYGHADFRCQSVADIVPTKSAAWTAPGGFGYLVSPEGARFLLSRIAVDGVAGDVDWRLVAYSLSAADRRSIARATTFAGRAIEFHHRFISRGRMLRAYVLLPSLVRHFDGGSVRFWDNELLHAHMAELTTMIAKRRLDRHVATPA